MLKRIFAWWDSATIGLSFTMWRTGAKLIGDDAQGNKYYEAAGKHDYADGRTRRWVVYHGVAEASRVPTEWHGWLHHTVDVPPTKEHYVPKPWEKAHLPNMTGTPLAYHPAGSLYLAGKGEEPWQDYQPWTPEGIEGELDSKDVKRIEGSVAS
ncbi:NADH:ubiquinone oxidoreductase subunit NDUFA12 [Aquisalinus flavus]|uniref:NADH dehydrogenase n=1 Tax=Aquisalinus flavus TaxID=1526572 RepID=A0A8J2V679_9PROT|nr:NADH:ubiquinone oxidoreductase subunit NDUFA12 [Aquisalinus flavus]GGD01190.1 NADH dehydrogenase [Aquisalinus flavus]